MMNAAVEHDHIRVALLWKQMSPYIAAGVRVLRDRGVNTWATVRGARHEAPFEDTAWGFPCSVPDWPIDIGELQSELITFDPHVVLVASWDVTAYRRLSRRNPTRALRVLCMDNQWLRTARQWVGRFIAPWYLRPAFDVAWVPGDGAWEFARRLGFAPDEIWLGLYAADTAMLRPVAKRLGEPYELPRAFLFVGRLTREKALDVLVAAYEEYRRQAADPWPLIVAGVGPFGARLKGVDGVEATGFLDPTEIAGFLARASCLVLPSRFEPWGVVIHEACAAGLSVIASRSSGAARELVVPGVNGALVEPGDVPALVRALHWFADLSDAERRRMGEAGTQLSQRFSPDTWAETILRGAVEHQGS